MPNCYRCHEAIKAGQASRRREEVRHIVSNGDQRTHYSSKLICSSCLHSEKVHKWKIMAIKWGSIAFGSLVVFGLLLMITLRSLAFSEALSQETSVTYQSPDFPCVRAINPTVTNPACLAAIAGRP
jgi:hypothetical protein